MYALMASFSPLVWIYFILIIMVAGFFVINLFLAVIFLEYGNAQAQIKADVEAAKTARSGRSGGSDTQRTQHNGGSDTQRTARGGGSPSTGRRASRRSGESTVVFGDEQQVLIEEGKPLSDGALAGETRKRTCGDMVTDTFEPVATSDWLGHFSTALVILNMVLMCMPYEGMSDAYATKLEDAASIISYIFIAEMFVKLLGLGCAGYWSDGWNILDGTIVSLSILEIVITLIFANMEGGNVSAFRILRMLRMLRVLRVLRLMKQWRGLYKIITTFVRAVPQMANLVFLIILTMFMFSLLGMQVRPSIPSSCLHPYCSHVHSLPLLTTTLAHRSAYTQLFGGMYGPEHGYSLEPCPGGVCPDPALSEKPEYHFDYCYPCAPPGFECQLLGTMRACAVCSHLLVPAMHPRHRHRAMLTIFILLTGEWIDAMEPAAAIIGDWCAAFFIFVVVLGKYLLLNLLVAVILKEFAEEDTGPDTGRSGGSDTSRTARALETTRSARSDAGSQSGVADEEAGGVPEQKKEHADAWPVDHSLYMFGPRNPIRRLCRWMIKQPQFDQVSTGSNREHTCIHTHLHFQTPALLTMSHPHAAGDHRRHHRLVDLPRARLAPPRAGL